MADPKVVSSGYSSSIPLIATILQREGLLSADDIESHTIHTKQTNMPFWESVLMAGKISEEQMADTLARYLRIPCVRLAAATIDSAVVETVPEALAVKHMCVPVSIEREDKKKDKGQIKQRTSILLAMVDPSDMVALQAIEFATNLRIKPAVSTRTEIADAIGRLHSPEQWLMKFVENIPSDASFHVTGDEPEGMESEGKVSKSTSVVKLVDQMLYKAINAGASDLHIEPSLNEVQVRMRHEGMLTDLLKLPKWLLEPIVSRLKILAKLNITERRRPQDGRLKVSIGEQKVDLRISTLPTYYGEKVVL